MASGAEAYSEIGVYNSVATQQLYGGTTLGAGSCAKTGSCTQPLLVPLSNYWLNQLQNSLAFLDSVSFFDIDFNNELDEIINGENRNYFISKLNQSLLEKITELRNQFKDAYIPSELNPKENLEEKDFLFTDAEERRKLLKETRNLGLILANKFVKYTKSASQGKLLFRKTIRK